MEEPIIQGLWIGKELSILESTCINSFLQNGYKYHLYVYNFVKNVPIGVILKDANEILDESEVYSYNNKSFSAISNRFRFELLYKKGGIWADTDVISIKKYNFTERDKYILISEPDKKYIENKVGSFFLRFPQGDKMLEEAINICKDKKKDILEGTLKWGLGPSTVKHIYDKYSLQEYLKPWQFGTSCACGHWVSIINPEYSNLESSNVKKYASNLSELPADTYFVHLWHEFWRRGNIDKNKIFPENCLYQQLVNRYKCFNFICEEKDNHNSDQFDSVELNDFI